VRWSLSPPLPFRAISPPCATKSILKTENRNKNFRRVLPYFSCTLDGFRFSHSASATIVATCPSPSWRRTSGFSWSFGYCPPWEHHLNWRLKVRENRTRECARAVSAWHTKGPWFSFFYGAP